MKLPSPDETGCTITGTDAPEWILGTDGDDIICAEGGDIVVTWGGTDRILTSPGVDVIEGKDSDSTLVVDPYDPDDVLLGEAKFVDTEGRALNSQPGSAAEYAYDNDLLRKLTADSRGLSAIKRAPRETAEPFPAATLSKEDNEAARTALKLTPQAAISDELLHREAAANESVLLYGAELSDSEVVLMRKRDAASAHLSGLYDQLVEQGLWEAVFVSVEGVATMNVESSEQAKVARSLGLDPRFVRTPRSDLAKAATETIADIQRGIPGVAYDVHYLPDAHAYQVVVYATEGEKQQTTLGEIVKRSSLTLVQIDEPFIQASGTANNCKDQNCYNYMPGMRGSHCTLGWVLRRGSTRYLLTSGHCYPKPQPMHSQAPTSGTGNRRLATNSVTHYNEISQGYDYQILSIPDSNQFGEADLDTYNGIFLGTNARHSLEVRSVANAVAGSTVCHTGYNSRTKWGDIPQCGSVGSTSAPGTTPGVTDSIWVPTMKGCRGDSGGPVWMHAPSGTYAVGIFSGSSGTVLSTSPLCHQRSHFVSLSRQLAHAPGSYSFDTSSKPSGRAALRYYSLLLGREPDLAGRNYWNALSCNQGHMEDMAFSFTVTGSEFRSRFPLNTWSSTDARVEALYNGLYDSNGGSYWTNVIWNSGNSASARSATADWVAWVLITNGGSSVPNQFDNRMWQVGSEGAPPMCQTNWN